MVEILRARATDAPLCESTYFVWGCQIGYPDPCQSKPTRIKADPHASEPTHTRHRPTHTHQKHTPQTNSHVKKKKFSKATSVLGRGTEEARRRNRSAIPLLSWPCQRETEGGGWGGDHIKPPCTKNKFCLSISEQILPVCLFSQKTKLRREGRQTTNRLVAGMSSRMLGGRRLDVLSRSEVQERLKVSTDVGEIIDAMLAHGGSREIQVRQQS